MVGITISFAKYKYVCMVSEGLFNIYFDVGCGFRGRHGFDVFRPEKADWRKYYGTRFHDAVRSLRLCSL